MSIRRPSAQQARLTALGTAVLAAAALLALPSARPTRSAQPAAASSPLPAPLASPNLTTRWPAAIIANTPARLADKAIYTPWYYLDAATSVGTASTLDGKQMRLVLRGPGEPREIRRVANTDHPQFVGFTASGDSVFWFEFTATDAGVAQTTLWRLDWRTGKAPVKLTADTGAAVFFESQFDLVVGDGQLHWIAVGSGDTPMTEVRSIPVGGGKVKVRQVPGTFALSTWPWLASAAGSADAQQPMALVNLATGQHVTVPTAATELVGCTPAWCRSLILGADGGATRIDLMHPDGTQRRRVAGGAVSAAIGDVALLDRFEVLTQGREQSNGSAQLAVYDLRDGATTVIANGIGMVSARAGMLWWSTGDADPDQWYALDLRTLT